MKLNTTFIEKLSAKSMIVITLAISGVTVLGPWAMASSSAATNYAGLCGSGYTHVKNSEKAGVVRTRVYMNKSTKKVCAFAQKLNSVGVAGKTVSIKCSVISNVDSSHRPYQSPLDSGRFRYYAGPVRTSYSELRNYYARCVGFHGTGEASVNISQDSRGIWHYDAFRN